MIYFQYIDVNNYDKVELMTYIENNINKYDKIIVEGIDNVGKTTFINELLTLNQDWGYIRNTYENDNDFKFWTHLLSSPDKLIMDRGYLSTLIYEPIMNSKIKITYHDNMLLDGLSVRFNVLHIMLDCDLDTLKQRYDEIGDDYILEWEVYCELYEAYRMYYKVLTNSFSIKRRMIYNVI